MSIRVGILGYGNLGRGVECAIRQNPDMELKAVFTRRAPETVKILTEGVPVYHVDEAEAKKDEIDVLILCGGSATDLPVQTPKYAQWFNVVDSFDTHAKIPEHFAAVDELSLIHIWNAFYRRAFRPIFWSARPRRKNAAGWCRRLPRMRFRCSLFP